MKLRILILILAGWAPSVAGQQVPDSSFRPPVPRPAFPIGAGPILCLDEAHHNFHTLANRFWAFGELARRDGFRVEPSRATFTEQGLARCRILVISNAQPNDDEWDRYPSPTPSAFGPDEIAAVGRWVESGGSLLLIADHQPLAGAAAALARRFGVSFTDGFAVQGFETEAGRDSSFRIPTLFDRATGTLAVHPIAEGRDSSERVDRIRSFTGQAFRIGPDARAVMVLPSSFVSVEPRFAWQFSATTPKRSVGGWLQGATLRVKTGRAAFFGEAAMFSAQLGGAARAPMGMNAPLAEENPQFVLNVLHWLIGLIDP